MAAHRRMWLLTLVNAGMAMYALSRNEASGRILGVLLLALAALTTVLAFSAGMRAR